DLRVVIADAAVQKNRRGQFELVQDFEQAPVPNPVAVVAPGEIARGLLAAAHRIHPQAGPEREMLDVERDIEGEPLASRPTVVFAPDDGRIGVSGMAGKLQHRDAPCGVWRLMNGLAGRNYQGPPSCRAKQEVAQK